MHACWEPYAGEQEILPGLLSRVRPLVLPPAARRSREETLRRLRDRGYQPHEPDDP